MIKIMKIIQTMKMKVTTEQTNTSSKLAIAKKFWCLYDELWTYFTPCSSVFNVNFEHVIVHRVVFFPHKHQRFYVFVTENVIILLSFLKNDCFLKIFFPRFNSHFRLVQMILKSVTFVQSHQVIEHFYYNNAHLDDIFYFASVRNSSLRKQINRLVTWK